MIPTGEYFLMSSILELQGRTAEKTFCSRTRRAISCEYCAPKSRTTIDWVSTNEFLKSAIRCKEERHVASNGTSLKINSSRSTDAGPPSGATDQELRESSVSAPRTIAT